jgi:2Fe-2S ferredoxin
MSTKYRGIVGDHRGLMEREITINIIRGEEKITLHAYPGEYRSLMLLLFDQVYYDDFGECKGMGRCGSCIVEVTYTVASLPPSDRNENTTLTKLGVTDPTHRLSCQLLVDKSLHNSIITLL